MKTPPFSLFIGLICCNLVTAAQTNVIASRMSEVFQETILHGSEVANIGDPIPSGNLNNPWEITYGPDHFLWITEARGYRVRRMNPATGAITTILDLSPGASGYLTGTEHTTFNRENWTNSSSVPWPQGGMMGLAIHPDFMNSAAPKKFVYIGYVHDQGTVNTNGTGQFYTNYLVRFTYNSTTNKLEAPVALCDTLPGSKDHNSGRMIIAPENGVDFLYYAEGDMGAGQFENLTRINKAQITGSYEGKILRFNLEADADADPFDKWIPSGTGTNRNPFNGAKQSAVWAKGMRNNQGLAYDAANDILYGSSHGPFSDDEINILEYGKNYGHPWVVGYSEDGNYNGAKVGPSGGSPPLIPAVNGEHDNALAIGSSYKDPLYTLYPALKGNTTTPWTIQYIYTNQNYTGSPGPTGAAQNVNSHWSSDAPSGMEIYKNSVIPGWKNSLLISSLKNGKVLRLKLNSAGTLVLPTPAGTATPLNDTVGVFFSQNRFRDLAVSTNGDTIFAAIDRDGTTSGPTAGSGAINSKCPGCIKRYVFLGYNDNAGTSTIPSGIAVAAGINNSCAGGTTIRINSDNNALWVPITDAEGDIVAEIKANGNNLGTVTSSFYKHSGAIRRTSGSKPYLNRNITITPQNIPATPVDIRLYLTAGELASLIAASNSGVTSVTSLSIFKNTDPCGASLTAASTIVSPSIRSTQGADFVLQASVSSFSTFYIAGGSTMLASTLLSFTGSFINGATGLQWKTANEVNESGYTIERSMDGKNFIAIGQQPALDNASQVLQYQFIDHEAAKQSAAILYYRLKLTDKTGDYSYSEIITINLPYIAGRATVFPNPATNMINLAIAAGDDGKAQWKLLDNAGRLILKQTVLLKKGNNNISISVNTLSAGIYYLAVRGEGIEQKIKLEKL